MAGGTNGGGTSPERGRSKVSTGRGAAGGAWVGVAVRVPGARLLIWNLGMISRYSSLSHIHEFIHENIGHEM